MTETAIHPPSEIIIGIDLGTTNSMSAYVYPDGAALVQNEFRNTFTPSVVAYTPASVLTGYQATVVAPQFPDTTFYSFKRFMGRSLKDVQEDLSRLPFTVSEGQNSTVIFSAGQKYISPEELSAEILKRIKTDTEQILGNPVKKAVITVPAYFDDAQRQATKNAAFLAGFEPVRIINEPTAAAIAYGLDHQHKGKILVYDLGGGTFDVSVLELKGKIFRVLSTSGNTRLGGDDFDYIIASDIKAQFEMQTGSPFSENPAARGYVKREAEQIKIELSASNAVAKIITDPLTGGEFIYKLTAEQLTILLSDKIEQTIQSVNQALSDAGITYANIADVVLVGGSTRIPAVRKRIEELFGKPPHTRINPDQVVAVGAAVLGHLLAGGRRDFVLMDVIPLSLGIETIGGSFSKLIMKNSSIPAKATEYYSTSVDNQTAINIDIYQGEREMVRDCRLLGKIKLSGIPPMPAGFPRLQVAFMVDNNGILTVSAVEERSGKSAHIEIIPEHGLSPQAVRKMIEDSIFTAEKDFHARNLADYRVKADMMVRGYDKIKDSIKNLKTAAEFSAIEQAVEAVRRVKDGDNPDLIRTAMDEMGRLTAEVTDEVMSLNITQALKYTF